MTDQGAVPLSELARAVAERRGAAQVTCTGAGTEFVFFTADNGEGYRVPRARVFGTVNNPATSAYRLQEQELMLTRWAVEHGIPGATVLELVDVEGYPVLVVSVEPDDGSPVDGDVLGQIVGAVHSAAPPDIELVAQDAQSIDRRIAERSSIRFAALAAKFPLGTLPSVDLMAEVLRDAAGDAVLTHLDLRRQNLRCQDGRPRALFDWSNALIAPPELELARMVEYAAIPANGLPVDEVLRGYERMNADVTRHGAAWLIYRLDAAIMLANVFDSVAADESLRSLFLDRVREFVAELQAAVS